MNTSTFLLYVGTWLLVALTPGPAVMCSMAHSTRHGFHASLAAISGIQLGNLLFFVAVAFGLGTLLATATTAFTILRIVGALYLFYLGLRMIVRSIWKAATANPPITREIQRRSLFLHGLLIQLTNPKALLFVSALLPQFIDPGRSVPLQLGILVLATLVVDAVVLSSYAYLAQSGAKSLRGSSLSLWLERAFAAGLLFFGFRLLVSRK
jgi:homoserine/homoserine lactone efflux protein